MLRLRVTNDGGRTRRWNFEPYGDEISLQPKDSLTVEVADGPDVVLEIRTMPDHIGDVVWVYVGGAPVAPSDLKVNDESVWPL